MYPTPIDYCRGDDTIAIMKKDTHPTYHSNATVTCACGNAIAVGATKEKMQIEICSACHPFYTGKNQLIDTAHRAERFEARRAKAKPETLKQKKSKVKSRTEQKKNKSS